MTISKSPDCNLPDLPGAIHPAIGFPNADGVFISKTDFAELAAYILQLRNWIEAASACLESR